MNAPPLWKAWITVAKFDAADIVALFELTPPAPQAVLIAEDPFGPNAVVEALYETEPDRVLLSRLTARDVAVDPVPDVDWVRQSQTGLAPVRAGRFFVYGAHDAGVVPKGVIPIRIEAGLAFGTGHHETTALCLGVLSDLAEARRFYRVLDLGTGSGLLAIGAAKLWKKTVLATDIDPVAVGVARDNARANGCGGLVRTCVADGFESPALRAAAPFDLIVANILAGPLTHLARPVASALLPGATVVLSGLLRDQERMVLSFYRALGFTYLRTARSGPWSALVLEKA